MDVGSKVKISGYEVRAVGLWFWASGFKGCANCKLRKITFSLILPR